MPDPIIDNNNPAANGSEPIKPDNTANNSVLDLTKVNDEEFAKIFDDPRLFKHDRFKSLAEAKQQLKTLQEQQSKAEEEVLKKNQEFEKLAEKKSKEAEAANTRANNAEINAEVVRVAASKGAIDLTAVKKLIDKGNIKIDDTGNIIGVDEAVEALTKASPYLFGQGNGAPDLGRGGNPAGGNGGGKRFKQSQLNDAKFYRENEKDIQYAMQHGMIDPN